MINNMTDCVFVTSWGEEIPVFFTTRRGLRNITLRPKTRPVREIDISKPWLTSAASALRFMEQKRRWIERIFAAAPEKAVLRPGDVIDVLGRHIVLRHDCARRANQFVEDGCGGATLIVGGAPDMFERRIRDFVREQFLVDVKRIIRTAPREFWPARVAVRDTVSRWGSCSSSGTMSFSWRLAFAPPEIMRYVVMHELAHTRHMDHSPAFWATVAELYGDGVGRAKRWLNIHGAELHKYL